MQTPTSMQRLRGHLQTWCAGALAALAVLATFPASPAGAGSKLEIVSLSNRPDKVSGGDVLVTVRVPVGTALGAVTVTLNGSDVRGAFWEDPAGHALVGLVTGLGLGLNRLEARATKVGSDTLILKNYPSAGPVFSGPRQEPFFCQTHQFRIYANGPFLTATQITDPCMVPTRVDWVYRTTGGAFVAFDPAGAPPADLAMTTTNEGHTVPYVVRLETGSVNRSIYQIAILDDPAVAGPDLRNHGDPGWNGRLAYTFGGGCGGGHYSQGSSTGGVLNHMMLSRGFAVASASLNVRGNNCNDAVSAETLMMVKERFIEAHGPMRYTIGWGCSGGANQQYMTANAYPGLLDGIIPQCSFPDGYGQNTIDARLLLNYYLNNAGVSWTQEEMRAVSGYGTFGHITNQGLSWAARLDPVPNRPGWPSALFNAIVPLEVRYDPITNPTGARATTYDANVNAFGRDGNGFARRPNDTVGIQWGLAALNAGQITTAQFLDLNDKIGGHDADSNFIARRTQADLRATQAAYETGRINDASQLNSVAILDFDNIYTDLSPAGDVHNKFHHFTTRERIRKAHGHVDNHVMWNGVFGARATVASAAAFDMMDAWLANVVADTSGDPRPVTLVRNRPTNLQDGCWVGGAAPTFVPETQFLGGVGTSVCNDQYPAFVFPRYVAGAPLTNDIVKCRLKKIDWDDYAVSFTREEQKRLLAIFAGGVCDWSKPGARQTGLLSPWINYTDVGKYVGDRPPKD